MELKRFVAEVERHLAVAVSGAEPPEVVERLIAALEPALRLTLLEALGAAAGEISRELAPGSVELRLRGGEPEFVVASPPAETALDVTALDVTAQERTALLPGSAEVGEVARINLRLPEGVKSRVEAAAARDGVSINSWLVRAAAAALSSASTSRQDAPTASGRQRYSGWVR